MPKKKLKYLACAEELHKIAKTMKDVKSQQAIVEAAQYYERMAAALSTMPQRQNSNRDHLNP